MQYKVGDKVVFKENYSGVKAGTSGTVLKVRKSSNPDENCILKVELEGGGFTWVFGRRLELDHSIKFGDRVVVKDTLTNQIWEGELIGKEGVVVSVNKGLNFPYRVRFDKGRFADFEESGLMPVEDDHSGDDYTFIAEIPDSVDIKNVVVKHQSEEYKVALPDEPELKEKDEIEDPVVQAGCRVFKHDSIFGGEYIVARVETNKVALVSIKDGNRYYDPVEVDGICFRLSELVGSDLGEWEVK